MGIDNPFSSKKVNVVVAAATPLYKDYVPQDRLQRQMVDMVRRDGDIARGMAFYNLTGYATRINALYSTTNNSYPKLIPTSNIVNGNFNEAAVTAVLDVIEGEATEVKDSILVYPEIYEWGIWWLYQNDVTYNHTNRTVVISGTTWTIVDVFGVYDGDEDDPTLIGFNINLDNVGTPGTYGEILDLPNANSLYYVVEYIVISAPAVRIPWLYEISLGTYPSLSTADEVDTSQIFPIIPLRFNDVNINNDKNSNDYIQTVNALRQVELNLDDITEAVTKDENGNNIADLNLISDIFFFMGVNIYGSTKEEAEVMYAAFDNFRQLSRTDKVAWEALTGVPKSEDLFSIRSNNFKYNIGFSYIEKTTLTGVKAEVGEYARAIEINPDIDHSYNRIDDDGASIPIVQPVNRNNLYIYEQISETQYNQLEVSGLRMTHFINVVTGGAKNYDLYLTAYTEGAALTEEQKSFVLPLSKQFTEGLSIVESDAFFPVSMHILYYAADRIKLEFYERPGFIKVLNVALVVLAVLSLFGDLSGTTGTVLLELGKRILIALALKFVLEQLFLTFDDDLTRTLGTIAAVLIAGELSGIDYAALSTADLALAAVNVSIKVADAYTNAELELLQLEENAFLKDFEEYKKEYEEAQETLEVRSALDVNSILSPTLKDYETPKDFIERTLNTEPGQQAVANLFNYVDNSLNLDYINTSIYR